MFMVKSRSAIASLWSKILVYALLHLSFALCTFLILYLSTGKSYSAISGFLGWFCVFVTTTAYTSYLFASGVILQPKPALMRQIKSMLIKHSINILLIVLCLVGYKSIDVLTFIVSYIVALLVNLVILLKLRF